MHVVFVTIGSLGDLYPVLAVATEWTRRGHRATVVSGPGYRERVEAAGLAFYPSAPVVERLDEETFRKTLDPHHGTRVLFQSVVLPAIADSYADLEQAIEAERPDALVANDLALAVPVAADVYGLPWAAAVLQPGSLLSAHDPPVSLAAPWLRPLGRLSPRAVRLVYRLLGRAARPWQRPVRQLRRRLGLAEAVAPLLRDKYEAERVLTLFSRVLAEPQPDWPGQTVSCGFPFYTERPETGVAHRPGDLPEDLARFFRAGPPPVVFTLGHVAAHAEQGFFETSLKAARALGERAVVVTGREDAPPLPATLLDAPDCCVVSYVPYGKLFAQARAVVHAGGIGTIGLALHAGVPQLIVPHVHDQPDNAARAARTGAARVLKPSAYRVDAVAAQLGRLLQDATYATRARTLADVVRAEPGAARACAALETMVRGNTQVPPGSPTA